MYKEIIEKLESIEKEHTIKILYAIESGSRGWGFSSQDSDYDVRFIYIRPQEWYLSIEEKKDFIEYPIDRLLDINGWDIKKALLLLKKSNPSLLEWLSSPILYKQHDNFTASLKKLAPNYFLSVPTIYHYFHLALNSYQTTVDSDTIKLKKYFYIIRPLLACMWIEKNNSIPPMAFSLLLEDANLPSPLDNQIKELLTKKSTCTEDDSEPKNPILADFLQNKLDHYGQYVKTVKSDKKTSYDPLNSLFRQTLQEAWR